MKVLVVLVVALLAVSDSLMDFKWNNCEENGGEPRFEVKSVNIEGGELTIVGTPSAEVTGGTVTFDIQRRSFLSLTFMGSRKMTLVEGEADLCDITSCPLAAGEEITITKRRKEGARRPPPGKYEMEMELFGTIEDDSVKQKLACVEAEFSVSYMSYLFNNRGLEAPPPRASGEKKSIAEERAEKSMKREAALAQKVACNSNYCRQSPINLVEDAGTPIFYTLNQNESLIDLTYLNKIIPLRRGPNYLSYIVRNGAVQPATLRINGKDYNLRNIHFHVPAEHTINGKRYAAEAHLVHEADADAANDGRKKFAVIGLLLDSGADDPSTIDNLLGGLLGAEAPLKMPKGKAKKGKEEEDDIGSLGDPNGLEDFVFDEKFLGDGDMFYYPGSLTTPPYSSDVTWLVAKQPVSVRSSLIKGMQALGVENYRPLQKSVSSSEVLRLVKTG